MLALSSLREPARCRIFAEAQAHEVETVLRRLHPDPKAGIQAEPAEPSSVDRRPYVDAGDSSTSCLQPYLGIAGLRPNGGWLAGGFVLLCCWR
eukprot:g17052.t1